MEFQKCSKCDYFSYEKDHVLAHIVDEHTKFKVNKGEYVIIELQTVMKKTFLGQTDTTIIPIELARKWNKSKEISIHEYDIEKKGSQEDCVSDITRWCLFNMTYPYEKPSVSLLLAIGGKSGSGQCF